MWFFFFINNIFLIYIIYNLVIFNYGIIEENYTSTFW